MFPFWYLCQSPLSVFIDNAAVWMWFIYTHSNFMKYFFLHAQTRGRTSQNVYIEKFYFYSFAGWHIYRGWSKQIWRMSWILCAITLLTGSSAAFTGVECHADHMQLPCTSHLNKQNLWNINIKNVCRRLLLKSWYVWGTIGVATVGKVRLWWWWLWVLYMKIKSGVKSATTSYPNT